MCPKDFPSQHRNAGRMSQSSPSRPAESDRTSTRRRDCSLALTERRACVLPTKDVAGQTSGEHGRQTAGSDLLLVEIGLPRVDLSIRIRSTISSESTRGQKPGRSAVLSTVLFSFPRLAACCRQLREGGSKAAIGWARKPISQLATRAGDRASLHPNRHELLPVARRRKPSPHFSVRREGRWFSVGSSPTR